MCELTVVLCESSDGKPHIGRFITSRNFGVPLRKGTPSQRLIFFVCAVLLNDSWTD